MPQIFCDFAVREDIVVASYRFEINAQLAELIDQYFTVRRRPGPDGVSPKRPQ
jgi:hypothetical protein